MANSDPISSHLLSVSHPVVCKTCSYFTHLFNYGSRGLALNYMQLRKLPTIMKKNPFMFCIFNTANLQGPLRAAASFMCQTTTQQKRVWQCVVGFADTAHCFN